MHRRYSVSLTQALRLPRFFTASSARPAAAFWLDGSMKIGGKQFWSLVLFWTQTFVMKAAFDYFVIIRPLVEPVGARTAWGAWGVFPVCMHRMCDKRVSPGCT